MRLLHRHITVGILLTAAVAVPGAHADVLADCKTAKSGEARIAACSAIIASKTVGAGERAEALRRRAAAYAERAANKEAEADFTEALRLEPSVGSALTGRANARLALGNADGAVADITEALRLSRRRC